MLSALGEDVKPLRDEFPQNILDVDLFRQLSGRNITLVGPDVWQLTREHEARALKACGISALYFGRFWGNTELWSQAIWIVKHWPSIDAFMRAATKGTIAEAQARGRVRPIPF